MNSDLDDDTVPLEPPLIPRLSTLTSTSPRHSKRDHQHSDFNSLQTYESPNNYDSDQIDPELEELFYTSIHHQTIGSMELTFDHFNQSTETQLSSTQPEETPLNEFPKVKSEDVKIFNSRKSLKKERKQIRAAREKALAAAEAASQFTVEPVNSSRPKLDLCFGNLIVGDGITSTLDPEEAMNKFYNEDLYDSDEERANYKRMSSDKRFWKIGQEDMLSNFGRRSLRFRQKECKHCGGGHLVKDCPRKLLCFICGGTRHIGQKCSLRVCSICLEGTGHISRKCPVRYELKSRRCDTCGEMGHTDKQCTQSWRKFLNVTDEETYLAHLNSKVIPNDPVVVNSIVSCANCGAMGKHFTCECPHKDFSNMRFQMPLPVANWHKIRKEQATKRNEPPPKNRSRKNALQTPFTKPSATTTDKNSTKAKGKGNKRPFTVEPEVIEVPDDSDSSDSVQYVLDLLKGSTQINDAPINSGSKRSQSHNNMNQSAKKKRKANVSQKFNYKQKSFKRKNNESPLQNRLYNSHGTSEKISFKKKKQREHCEGRFKRKTK